MAEFMSKDVEELTRAGDDFCGEFDRGMVSVGS